MKKMIVLVPLLAFACGDDTGTNPDMATADMTAGADMTEQPDMTPPAPPTLGKQIDRMGRPGVNTALTDPFDTVSGMTPDQVKDSYNAEADRTKWQAAFTGAASMTDHKLIKGNLAILDGLDRDCTNQVARGLVPNMPYQFLASFLADDVLLVDTTQSTCKTYLGVEAHALLQQPADCGGRTPTQDVIDETYSLLAAGAFSGVTDGVDKDGEGAANDTTFPFLGEPNK